MIRRLIEGPGASLADIGCPGFPQAKHIHALIYVLLRNIQRYLQNQRPSMAICGCHGFPMESKLLGRKR
jgi:hypothetical protein